MAARIAMMAITTRSSINVNPEKVFGRIDTHFNITVLDKAGF
jgi:hypothetical protein